MDIEPTATLPWRPSRCVVGAQLFLGALGAIACLASALPGALAMPSALVALLAGAWQAVRFAHRAPRRVPIAELDLSWRGPLAFDTRTGLSWWPDTLDARGRRSLRLAASRQE